MTRTELINRLNKKKEQLATLEATYDQLISEPIEQYTFDSGEGRQSAKRRKLAEIKDQMKELESEIDQLCRKLNGSGLTNVGLRRKRRYF